MVRLRERINRLGRMPSVQKYRNLLNGAVHEPTRGPIAECDPMYQILQSILHRVRNWDYLRDLLNKIEDDIRRIEDEMCSGRGSGRH